MTIWLLVHCLLELVSNWNKSFRAENSFSLRQSHASGAPGHATYGYPQAFCSLPQGKCNTITTRHLLYAQPYARCFAYGLSFNPQIAL